MRPLVLLLLAAACTQPGPPPVIVYAALDGKEPTVRVWLRSLGDAKKVSGKGGLRDAGQLHTDAVPLADDHVFEPVEGIFTIDAGHTYAGKLEVRGGKLINHVPLENYVLGVLRGELPLRSVPKAAAGAQAIAVRSYTLHHVARGDGAYDVDDTTLFQRYVGLKYAPDDKNLRAGVQRTTGLYLSVDGKPLKAYYHSTCGGHTTDEATGLDRNDAPSLRGVPCDFCVASKYYRWDTELSDGEILRAASVAGPLRSFEVSKKGPGERAQTVAVTTGGMNFTHAGKFRLAVGASKLRSVRILNVAKVEGGYRVEGAGWGHGVGLCQMGAIGQGREGGSAQEIVAYYYPAATIRRAY